MARPSNLISVGDTDIFLQKLVKKNIYKCNQLGVDGCKDFVVDELSPFISRMYDYKTVEFSIIRCALDYNEIKEVFLEGAKLIPKITNCQSEYKIGPWRHKK